MSNGTASTAATASTQTIGIPRPSTPGALTNQNLQNVSFYKTLRSVINILGTTTNTTGATSLGTVATTATDGTPATFAQGGLDAVLIRVTGAGNAANLGLTNEWVAGGGETTVAHGLNRVPIGYWVVRKNIPCDISDGDSAWTSANIYFHTTHSDADTILMIF